MTGVKSIDVCIDYVEAEPELLLCNYLGGFRFDTEPSLRKVIKASGKRLVVVDFLIGQIIVLECIGVNLVLKHSA